MNWLKYCNDPMTNGEMMNSFEFCNYPMTFFKFMIKRLYLFSKNCHKLFKYLFTYLLNFTMKWYFSWYNEFVRILQLSYDEWRNDKSGFENFLEATFEMMILFKYFNYPMTNVQMMNSFKFCNYPMTNGEKIMIL